MMKGTVSIVCLLAAMAVSALAQDNIGYYRFPSLYKDSVVFTAEGDLWRVPVAGGLAQRLTSGTGQENNPAISPDGKTIAFSAEYEGSVEVYTMPLDGGLPVRHTWEGQAATVAGWTPDGRILYSTRFYSGLPRSAQLVKLDPKNNAFERVPLSQADQGVYDDAGKTLFFTRLPFHNNDAKRYKGGSVQQLWKYKAGAAEAVPLTPDYPGCSKEPMWWKGRVYFSSDRDGTVNIWSMDEGGTNLKQLTHHSGWDVQGPSLSDGRIVYQAGADLWMLDVATGKNALIPIRLASDFEQQRERWIRKPLEWLTSVHVSPDGDRIVLTTRGDLFVFPAKTGRSVRVNATDNVRYREARFSPDGKSVIALSDESGEVEVWRYSARGNDRGEQLTTDGKILRWEAIPSPDGKWIAHHNKDQELWVLNMETKEQKRIAVGNERGRFDDLRWSPDSRWLLYGDAADNLYDRLMLYSVETGSITPITSDRFNSESGEWSADGKWIYFLSDRNLRTVVPSPWGTRQPEPFFDKPIKIYELALRKGQRSPFQPADELQPTAAKEDEKKKEAVRVDIDMDGIETRLREVPVPPGNYHTLSASEKRLFWVSRETTGDRQSSLQFIEISNKEQKPETLLDGIRIYELSQNRKKILAGKGEEFFVFDSGAAPSAVSSPKAQGESKVDLKDWMMPQNPKQEIRQMFLDAWRLERDYFYDRNMHGIDWPAMRDRYIKLVDRVRDREELSDLLAQMIGELSALHVRARGGEFRKSSDQVHQGLLGARLVRDESAGGYRVDHIYRNDPDLPDELSPLAQPGVDVSDGEVIEAVNGTDALTAPDIGWLLREQAAKQVLLRVRGTDGKTREVVVRPISPGGERDLQYSEWEYSRRLEVEMAGGGKIGYVHLRAMGPGDIAQWMRDFYPVFNRQGLIIDVRQNGGGNIDSWILARLLRKAWFFWQSRTGEPYWNMQYAFRGHMVVLMDQQTASDGEAFAEGFRRLGLGKLIGMRTWGGQIWLSSSNVLVDRGIASAAENGVYGPERKWLIEGHGVDPDITVDNLPHATFTGKDAQLEAALGHLEELIRKDPREVPPAPPYPNHRFPYTEGSTGAPSTSGNEP